MAEFFHPATTFIDSLEKARKCQFGVFIFAKDDRMRSQGGVIDVPRDNVVFEAGLMAGARRFQRVLILLEEGCRLLSDLRGFNVEKFCRNDVKGENPVLARTTSRRGTAGNACQTLGDACKKLRAHIKDEWRKAPVSIETRSQIRNLLELSSRAATFGTNLKVEDVRAFCHLHDGDHTLRHVACFMGNLLAVDGEIDVPCDARSQKEDWFIIAKAFLRTKFILEKVDWARARREAIPGADHVDSRLSLVAAYPIIVAGEARGTVCFDSLRAASKVGWTQLEQKERLRATLKTVADIIGSLL